MTVGMRVNMTVDMTVNMTVDTTVETMNRGVIERSSWLSLIRAYM